jgi:hypothetical protein
MLYKEMVHVLPSKMFNSYCQQVNIIFTKDGVCTLVNLITIKPTQVDILVQSYSTQVFITSKAIHIKEKSYRDQHPTLTIEVFGYLHKQTNVFLHDCVNVVWSLKGPKHPPLSILVTYFYQKIPITLQKCKHLPF